MKYPIPFFVTIKSFTLIPSSFLRNLVTFTVSVLSSMNSSLYHSLSMIRSRFTIFPAFSIRI